MQNRTIQVAVVDDHPVVRAGIRAVLASAPDLTIVAEGASGADALRLGSDNRIDVLILDVNLPDVNGLEVTRRLRDRGHTTPVVILTVHNERRRQHTQGLETALRSRHGGRQTDRRPDAAIHAAVEDRGVERAAAHSTPRDVSCSEVCHSKSSWGYDSVGKRRVYSPEVMRVEGDHLVHFGFVSCMQEQSIVDGAANDLQVSQVVKQRHIVGDRQHHDFARVHDIDRDELPGYLRRDGRPEWQARQNRVHFRQGMSRNDPGICSIFDALKPGKRSRVRRMRFNDRGDQHRGVE